MPERIQVDVTVTEIPQFRRLVEFVQDVETHAREAADDPELDRLLDRLDDDLAAMKRGT